MTQPRIFLLSILLCLSGYTYGQNAVLPQELYDALPGIAESQRDSLFNRIADHYQRNTRNFSSAFDSVSRYGNMALSVASAQLDTFEMIRAYSNLQWAYRIQRGKRDSSEWADAKRDTLLAYFGYYSPASYKNWDRNHQYNITRSLWVMMDSAERWDFPSLLAADTAGAELFQYNFEPRNIAQMPDPWWMRIRVQTGASIPEEHTFVVSNQNHYWDSIEVWYTIDSVYHKSLAGLKVDESDRSLREFPSFVRLTLPAHFDGQIYFRLKGKHPENPPNLLLLRHTNLEAFVYERAEDRHKNGIFQGVVVIQLLFFFFLYLATKDRIYGFYAVYVLGLELIILNVSYFSESPNFTNSQVALGFLTAGFLVIFGITKFAQAYLNLNELLPYTRKLINIFLMILLGLTIVFAIYFTSVDLHPSSELPAGYIFFLLSCILVVLLTIIFLIIWGIQAMRKNYTPARYFLLATSCLVLALGFPFYATFFDQSLLNGPFLATLSIGTIVEGGIALQLSMFAFGVGHQRNVLEKERTEAMQDNLDMQQKINAATDRFVPYEFLRSIGRESILDVNLGDQVQKNVSVFFSDIRDYTTLSEQMTPQQNFIFLNAYLGRVGPVIKTNRGFVNQYFGDGIMALFMSNEQGLHSPSDSVHAAVEMHQELRRYNDERLKKGRNSIKIGIGIHTGPLMLGVIGDSKRMDVGVVSDTVNTASRMEGLTKFYGAPIIISHPTFEGMDDHDAFNYRYLGKVQVKGKKEPLGIYDVFDGDLPEIAEHKLHTLKTFSEGMEAYFRREFVLAKKAFADILAQNPQDKSARYYFNQASYYAENGAPEGWNGVETMLVK
ncbi:MAG: adenylate/guanylate cyclase domain-containing protein [Bacteroidota bacterium]